MKPLLKLRPDSQLLDSLLRDEAPLIDLRAPREFAQGSLPGAISLPILTDSERHQVGRCYKSDGRAAALALGRRLVSGPLRAARIAGWQRVLASHPDAWLFCWRGGLRSATALQWLEDQGLAARQLAGGYKAVRSHCLDILDRRAHQLSWLVVGGRTGVGKTVVLNRVTGSIDLEGLARHRGSAFGGSGRPQPTPINFENALAAATLRSESRSALLVLEDESRTIGRLALPHSWHQHLQQAPLVLLEADIDERARHIAAEYVVQPVAQGEAPAAIQRRYLAALVRIRRRLGGDRADLIGKAIEAAFSAGAEADAHLPWIRMLLETYYDPMYDYQLARKRHRIIFQGGSEAVEAYLNQRRAESAR